MNTTQQLQKKHYSRVCHSHVHVILLLSCFILLPLFPPSPSFRSPSSPALPLFAEVGWVWACCRLCSSLAMITSSSSTNFMKTNPQLPELSCSQTDKQHLVKTADRGNYQRKLTPTCNNSKPDHIISCCVSREMQQSLRWSPSDTNNTAAN